jgi:hypothetical protein
MRYLLCLSALSLALVGQAADSANPANLKIKPSDTALAMTYVEQLGNTSYRIREQARRDLTKMGRRALHALTQGLNSSDTETRVVCELLLPAAESQEMEARVQTFLADAKGEYEHELPGWARFRFVAGDNPFTRQLFVAVVKNPRNFPLLQAMKEIPDQQLPSLAGLASGIVFAHPERPSTSRYPQVLNDRRISLYQQHMEQMPNGGIRQTTPTVSDHAFLMLAESLVSERETNWNPISYQLISWLYQQQLRDAALGNSEYKASYRDIFMNWVETRDGVNNLSQMVNLAQNLNLGTPMIGRLAGRMLTLPNNQPWTKANAVSLLARHKCVDRISLIRQTFDDEAVVVNAQPMNNQPEIQVRDIALAMTLLLTNQDPKNYGFAMQHPQEQMRFNYTNYRFTDDGKDRSTVDKRMAAFQKWREWEANQIGGLCGSGVTQLMLSKK